MFAIFRFVRLCYNVDMEFSIRLKELRESRGLSQAQLAQEIGVGISTVGMWESTNRVPNAKTLEKLLSFFRCSLDYLLGRTDDFGAAVTGDQTLSWDEREVLELYSALSPTRKEDLKIYLRALSGASVKPEKKNA